MLYTDLRFHCSNVVVLITTCGDKILLCIRIVFQRRLLLFKYMCCPLSTCVALCVQCISRRVHTSVTCIYVTFSVQLSQPAQVLFLQYVFCVSITYTQSIVYLLTRPEQQLALSFAQVTLNLMVASFPIISSNHQRAFSLQSAWWRAEIDGWLAGESDRE